jgi:integrator complex subunit 1
MNPQDWPIEFVQIYLDDSLGSRGWVDDAECKVFISNVRTAWDRKADKEKKG